MQLRLILILGCLSCGAATPSSAQGVDDTRFDGKWAVTLVCPGAQDGALPFNFNFIAEVTNGTIHGENGLKGQPGWMSLDGRILPDGKADLDARGLTGSPEYNIKHTGRTVPYEHPVSASFDNSQGSGSWVTTRTCIFTFRKQ